MKIFFSGYYNPRFESITESVEGTMRDMGHVVETFDCNKFIMPGRVRDKFPFLHRLDLKRINRRLLELVKKFKPDMLFVLGGYYLFPETIVEVKNMGNIDTVNWVADYPLGFDVQMRTGAYYDYFFTSGTDGLQKYKESGKQNGHWLPFGCYPKVHRPLILTEEEKDKYGCDVCFVGSNYPERIKILEKLSDFDLGIWGIGWERLPIESSLSPLVRGGIVRPLEWVKVFKASKIVLNINPRRESMKDLYNRNAKGQDFRMCNTRAFEVLACGAFQIMNAQADAMTLFGDKKHIVFYRDTEELISLVKYYLANPEERKVIAEEGRKEVLRKHTYRHRIEEILSIIGKKTRK